MIEYERNCKDEQLYTAISNPYLDLRVKKYSEEKPVVSEESL